MNKELDKVTGQVQAVSSRFNGAFKVNDVWYNFSKNCTRPAVENGDTVSLSLEGWEAKGKSGVNVVKCDVSAKATLPKEEEKVFTATFQKPVPATDWASKDRSQLVGGRSHDAAELVNVSLQTGTKMDKVLELYREALVGILKVAEEVK